MCVCVCVCSMCVCVYEQMFTTHSDQSTYATFVFLLLLQYSVAYPQPTSYYNCPAGTTLNYITQECDCQYGYVVDRTTNQCDCPNGLEVRYNYAEGHLECACPDGHYLQLSLHLYECTYSSDAPTHATPATTYAPTTCLLYTSPSPRDS